MNSALQTSSQKLSKRRRVVFRCAAVLVGLGLVASLEFALRQTDLGRIEDIGDPFIGFSNVVPLFVPNKSGTRFEIPVSRQVFFQPDGFAAQKGADEFRIFCLGGSTVQGRPYSIETSFTTWLELTLKAADPSINWQVVNCGGVSYASYRLIPIMQELLAHGPDLFVVYTGHNEFLESRTYTDVETQSTWQRSLHYHATSYRIYGVARQLIRPVALPTAKMKLQTEVDALLDYQGGLEKYRRDDAWRNNVVTHYEHNLRRMAHIARSANIPLVFLRPVANVRDTPPFKVETAKHSSESVRVQFNHAWKHAVESDWSDLDVKADAVLQALELDERHAGAHFLMGKVEDARQDFAAAKMHYVQAKDEDICPLRMLESMHDVLGRVADQTRTPLIDVRRRFEQLSKHGIPGDDLLVDHVHPRIEGHQEIADLLFEFLTSEGFAQTSSDWQTRRKNLYRKNFETLPSNYFPESVARLRGLQDWAKGWVTRLRIDESDE